MTVHTARCRRIQSLFLSKLIAGTPSSTNTRTPWAFVPIRCQGGSPVAMGQNLMASFLSTLASGTQQEALQALQLCKEAPGFEVACMAGALDACKILDQADGHSRPLEVACRKGFAEVVDSLLTLGSDPTLSAVRWPTSRATLQICPTMCMPLAWHDNKRGAGQQQQHCTAHGLHQWALAEC